MEWEIEEAKENEKETGMQSRCALMHDLKQSIIITLLLLYKLNTNLSSVYLLWLCVVTFFYYMCLVVNACALCLSKDA